MHLSFPKRFPLFILASSVCKSLQCLISALTQRVESGHLFRLTCSAVLWGGRKTTNKYHWRVWGVLAVFQPHWVCPRSRCVCFHGLHFSGSRLLCQNCLRRALDCVRLPWDSPGQNTGSGCHFPLQCLKMKSESEAAQSCPTLSNPMVKSLSRI